jgi:hypothetical protein
VRTETSIRLWLCNIAARGWYKRGVASPSEIRRMDQRGPNSWRLCGKHWRYDRAMDEWRVALYATSRNSQRFRISCQRPIFLRAEFRRGGGAPGNMR